MAGGFERVAEVFGVVGRECVEAGVGRGHRL